MTFDPSRHPCFNDKVRHKYGRVHLPVAPKCNVQCNFCNRRHDCVNESRPGVTSHVLSPGQALHYLHDVMQKKKNLSVVGIAGPGDPFANAAETLETMQLIHQHYPDMLLCVASNGLEVAPYVEQLSGLNVSHVTITVNAVDPDIGAKIYGWIRYKKRVLRGREGAEVLWAAQKDAIRQLKQAEITVKINTIIIPGVNDTHVTEIAETVAALGADICNCIGMYAVADTPFEDIVPPDDQEVAEVRKLAGEFIPLMHHCTRCRADAVGLLGEEMPTEILESLNVAASLPLRPQELRPQELRPCVAVASQEGVLVNQHLGEARQLLIYRLGRPQPEMVEVRETPPRGGGTDRWQELADSLHDCRAILVASAGEKPRTTLSEAGVRVIMMEGLIEEGLNAVQSNLPIRAPLRCEHSCGSGCAGDGTGCG